MRNSVMRRLLMIVVVLAMGVAVAAAGAQEVAVSSPDGRVTVVVAVVDGAATYAITYDSHPFLLPSPLGFVADTGDFSSSLTLVDSSEDEYSDQYSVDRIKTSAVEYHARQLTVTLRNAAGRDYSVLFRVSNNDVAFRYLLPSWPDEEHGKKMSVRVLREATGFVFPASTTTFLCPQRRAGEGWKGTAPSYEEEYVCDAALSAPSQYGIGYTFPCLFHIGAAGWLLLSESAVDSRYCGSRLSEWSAEEGYTIAFPQEEENNSNGTVAPAFALPGRTPWRTLTVGRTLDPIVESTAAWDNALPRYESRHKYEYGRSTWSWILWQDKSITYEDQVQYIDLAAAMGYEFVLIDNYWDTQIGREKVEALITYARRKGVGIFLWYSSSGYWNDIEQGPINRMDNAIVRKNEMRWLQEQGVRGIKVDFFAGDKQETLRLYEDILSDADDHGLMVIFHGCTLPRGWERMYPNYVGSEAVLASENMIFDQHFCDEEAHNACLHPFIRNAVASMEFGGCFMNTYLNRANDESGHRRRTSLVAQLAMPILFQNAIQNIAIAPNNLSDTPSWAMDYLRAVPTTWDETRFIDGYPGRYVVLARRKGTSWYVAGVNATSSPLSLSLSLPFLSGGDRVTIYRDDDATGGAPQEITLAAASSFAVTLPTNGGIVLTTSTDN